MDSRCWQSFSCLRQWLASRFPVCHHLHPRWRFCDQHGGVPDRLGLHLLCAPLRACSVRASGRVRACMSELHLKQKFHFPVNHFGLKSGEQLKSLLLTEAVWLCRESETSVLSVEHCPRGERLVSCSHHWCIYRGRAPNSLVDMPVCFLKETLAVEVSRCLV